MKHEGRRSAQTASPLSRRCARLRGFPLGEDEAKLHSEGQLLVLAVGNILKSKGDQLGSKGGVSLVEVRHRPILMTCSPSSKGLLAPQRVQGDLEDPQGFILGLVVIQVNEVLIQEVQPLKRADHRVEDVLRIGRLSAPLLQEVLTRSQPKRRGRIRVQSIPVIFAAPGRRLICRRPDTSIVRMALQVALHLS